MQRIWLADGRVALNAEHHASLCRSLLQTAWFGTGRGAEVTRFKLQHLTPPKKHLNVRDADVVVLMVVGGKTQG